MLGIIIPIDFHIFQRGSNHQPDMVLAILQDLSLLQLASAAKLSMWRAVKFHVASALQVFSMVKMSGEMVVISWIFVSISSWDQPKQGI